MKEEIKFLFKELNKEDLYSKDMIKGFRCWKVVHTDEGGYTEHDLKFYLYNGGGLTISESDGDNHIYIYPEQIENLKKILKEI